MTPELRSAAIEDGLVIADDGEVLGLPHEGTLEPIPGRPGEWAWKPGTVETRPLETLDEADAILERIATAEANAFGIACRLQAIVQNLSRLERRQQTRAAYLRWRFGPQLEQVARRYLAGRKGKTLTLANGQISFRKSAGAAHVVDQAAAVAWAEENSHAELVKTVKSVAPGAARKVIVAELDAGFIDFVPAWLQVDEPSEKCSIKTSIPGELDGRELDPSVFLSDCDRKPQPEPDAADSDAA